MTDSRADSGETVLVMNPNSGSGDHPPAVRDRATLLGYDLRETQWEGHAIELARDAAEQGAKRVIAVGGDGTLNEVVSGVLAADALDRVTLGVVPAGTGNDFASNIGIDSLDDAFHCIEDGERRKLDLGFAGEKPFLNSCVAGITARASGNTSSALKSKFGVLAYVLQTLQMMTEYRGIELEASVVDGSDSEEVWEGTATVVLVGNGRRFSLSGSEQANIEDGLLDVTIIEDVDSLDLAEERLQERLLNEEGEHLTRLLASTLQLTVEEDNPTTFSLDGEMVDFDTVTLTNRRQCLRMPVGDRYDPKPRVD